MRAIALPQLPEPIMARRRGFSVDDELPAEEEEEEDAIGKVLKSYGALNK